MSTLRAEGGYIYRDDGNLASELVVRPKSPSLTTEEVSFLESLPPQSRLKQAYLQGVSGDTGGLTTAELAALRGVVPGADGFVVDGHGWQIDFADRGQVTDIAWTGATGTVQVTREITLDGLPVLRVDMPAACTRVDLGAAAGVAVPASWDTAPRRTFGVAVYPQDMSLHNLFQLFVGDATYTNYDLLTVNARGTQPWNGWHVMGYRNGTPGELAAGNGGGAAVVAANVTRAKLRIQKDVAQPAVLYLSWMGTMPKESPKILWTADDGYDEWATWLRPVATLHGIPWALGFDRYYVDNAIANFMTDAQVRDMAADASGLFEMYPHGYFNQGYTDVGLAQYLANDDATWAWLQARGVRNQRTYHPYVKGQFGDDLAAAMKARGVRIGRMAETQGAPGRTHKTSIAHIHRPTSHRQVYIGLDLNSGTTLAAAKAAIDAAEASGGLLAVMAHEFVDAAPSGLQWLKTDAEALMAYAASRQRAGRLENIRASKLAARLPEAV